jgi:hypothetical protein
MTPSTSGTSTPPLLQLLSLPTELNSYCDGRARSEDIRWKDATCSNVTIRPPRSEMANVSEDYSSPFCAAPNAAAAPNRSRTHRDGSSWWICEIRALADKTEARERKRMNSRRPDCQCPESTVFFLTLSSANGLDPLCLGKQRWLAPFSAPHFLSAILRWTGSQGINYWITSRRCTLIVRSVKCTLRRLNYPSIKKWRQRKMRNGSKYHTRSAEWKGKSPYTLYAKSRGRGAMWRYWYNNSKLRLMKPDRPKKKWINKFLWRKSLQYNFTFDPLFHISIPMNSLVFQNRGVWSETNENGLSVLEAIIPAFSRAQRILWVIL